MNFDNYLHDETNRRINESDKHGEPIYKAFELTEQPEPLDDFTLNEFWDNFNFELYAQIKFAKKLLWNKKHETILKLN